MKFTEWLKNERLNRGMNQQMFADFCKLSMVNINWLETRKRKPGLKTLRNLSEALNVDVEELVRMVENEDKK